MEKKEYLIYFCYLRRERGLFMCVRRSSTTRPVRTRSDEVPEKLLTQKSQNYATCFTYSGPVLVLFCSVSVLFWLFTLFLNVRGGKKKKNLLYYFVFRKYKFVCLCVCVCLQVFGFIATFLMAVSLWTSYSVTCGSHQTGTSTTWSCSCDFLLPHFVHSVIIFCANWDDACKQVDTNTDWWKRTNQSHRVRNVFQRGMLSMLTR